MPLPMKGYLSTIAGRSSGAASGLLPAPAVNRAVRAAADPFADGPDPAPDPVLPAGREPGNAPPPYRREAAGGERSAGRVPPARFGEPTPTHPGPPERVPEPERQKMPPAPGPSYLVRHLERLVVPAPAPGGRGVPAGELQTREPSGSKSPESPAPGANAAGAGTRTLESARLQPPGTRVRPPQTGADPTRPPAPGRVEGNLREPAEPTGAGVRAGFPVPAREEATPLRPARTEAPPASPARKEAPARLVIGRITVEVVPPAGPAVQTAPRPERRPEGTPPPPAGSQTNKLSFGLGQL